MDYIGAFPSQGMQALFLSYIPRCDMKFAAKGNV